MLQSLPTDLAPALLGVAALLTGAQVPDRLPSLDERLTETFRTCEEGRLEPCAEELRRLLPELRRAERPESLRTALDVLGQVSVSLGRYEEAIAWAKEAAGLYAEAQDAAGEAGSLNSLGLAHLYLGHYDRALAHYELALAIDRRVGDPEGEILRLNNIANVHFYEGSYAGALAFYLQALGRLEESSGEEWSSRERIRTVANLAALYQKLGQNQRALSLYRELLQQPEVLGRSEEARLLTNIGVLYRHLGDPVQALEFYQQARALFARWRHAAGELGVLRNIGILQAINLRNLEEARATFTRVIDLARSSGNLRTAVQGLLYRAEAERRLDLREAAQADFQEALAGSRQLGLPEEEWKALFGLARIAQVQGRPGPAASLLAQALETIESLRARLAISSLRPEFLADKRDVYDALIASDLFESPGEEASVPRPGNRERLAGLFELMERARSRTFQDLLGDSLEAARSRRSPEQVARLREIRSQLGTLWSRQLAAAREEHGDLLQQANELEIEYATVEASLHAREPLMSASPLRLDEVQTALRRLGIGMLVAYWVGKDFVAWVWVTPDDSGSGGQRGLSAASVEPCLRSLSAPSERKWREDCRRFSSLILAPLAEANLPGDAHLLVVPDGFLEAVPFESLELPSGELVLNRLAVHYAPSASVLTETEGAAASRPAFPWDSSLSAFGDPVAFDSGRTEGFESWPPLPYAEAEILTIAGLLPGRESLFLGKAALKSRLPRNGSPTPPVIHLATHAAIDPENPDRSRIVFSGTGSEGPFDYLFLREIPSYDFSGTHLMTFSACESAAGRVLAGEGMQNFSRAVLLSGARVTVTSLWKVDDQATAELMKQFYFQVERGLPVAEALRRAKLAFVASGSVLSHPFYWAPFIASGRASVPVPLPISWGMLLLVLAAGFAVLLLATAGLKRRRPLPQGRGHAIRQRPRQGPY